MSEDPSFLDGFNLLYDNINGFIRGNDAEIRLALVCLFAEGHLLIEGVPGVAKTSLAKAIARSIAGAGQKRIQFTPDLLPSDVTGSQVFRPNTGEFRFQPGPVFANVLLADEINRASPRTQSALLEVMAERQVTVDGTTHPVPTPFICVATQNPIEHRGTFPLPEAQIDRFMMKVSMRPPGRLDELSVLSDALEPRTLEDAVRPKLELADISRMIRQARRVRVKDAVRRYIVDIVATTRLDCADLRTGVSPRATIALGLAAQAYAASFGRSYVTPDDVKELAAPVLRHRLVLSRSAVDRGVEPDTVIDGLLKSVTAPPPGEAALEA